MKEIKNKAVKNNKPKEQLSLIERIKKNIPEGTFKGLSQILEPHEIPVVK
jgi:hypothetical protein